MKKQLRFKKWGTATLFVLLAMASHGQQVGDTFATGDIEYEIEYEITSSAPPEVRIVVYKGTATEVDIPSEVSDSGETYTVTAIGEDTDVFQGDATVRPFIGKGLTRVTIPNTVAIIGLGAFTNNRLEEVEIPNSVTHIRRWGFSGNQFTELAIPPNVEYIGQGAFFANQSQNVIVRSNGNPPPEIHETAFDAPTDIIRSIDLVVPFAAIQAYEDSGWKDMDFVRSITAGVAIDDVDGVKYGIVDAPNEATVIGQAGGDSHLNPVIHPTVNIDGATYDVTAIGDGAFDGRAVLSIHIPSSVRSIGSRALHATANSLGFVVVEGEDPPTLAADAFEPVLRRDRVHVVVEGSKERVDDYIAAGWTNFASITPLIGQIHNNEGVRWKVTSTSPYEMELNDFSFNIADNEDVTVVVDGEEVMTFADGHLEIRKEIDYHRTRKRRTYKITSIGDNVFDRSYQGSLFGGRSFDVHAPLTSVNIPGDVTRIGSSAFANNELTEVDLPNALTHIGDYTFSNNQLTSVGIPNGVTSIGDHAFDGNQLTSVGIPDGVTRIGHYTFSNNQLTSAGIPNGVTNIGISAFDGNQLTSVNIPNNVTNIEQWAFANNPDLRLVTVEADNPPRLHEDAFVNAYRDQIDLVVPFGRIQEYLDNGWHGFRSISYGIFTVDNVTYGITSNTDVMVVDYIGGATEVEIPETVEDDGATYTVTTIKENALQNKGLASVGIPNSVTTIGEGAFSDNQLTAVTIPGSMERIAAGAFYNNPDLSLVMVEANDPPVLDVIAFVDASRHQIDLVVPAGRVQEYLDNGWDGFRTISEDVSPRPTIGAPQSVDDLEPFAVDIAFDIGVTDFVADDILVTNATVIALTGSGSIYTATLTATSLCDGISIDVPANVATGVNGLSNLAAEQVSVGTVNTIFERCGPEPLVGLNGGFSPNGDGIGDTLVIEGLEHYRNNVVRIYDLGQRLLFSAHYGGPADGWDGTDKDGMVPVGSYVCVIDYNEPGLGHEAKMIYVNY